MARSLSLEGSPIALKSAEALSISCCDGKDKDLGE
jgi:hypothetical protein